MTLLEYKKIRYLLAGGWNSLFGYGVGVGLYYALSNYLHLIWIGVISNIIAITMSFLTYKLFVFQTKGQWLQEYLRCYLVYGGMALLGVMLLWVMVDILHVQIWVAQGIIILGTVICSYIGHTIFTFRKRKDCQVGEYDAA